VQHKQTEKVSNSMRSGCGSSKEPVERLRQMIGLKQNLGYENQYFFYEWNVSHSQVRRWIRNHYPELKFYER